MMRIAAMARRRGAGAAPRLARRAYPRAVPAMPATPRGRFLLPRSTFSSDSSSQVNKSPINWMSLALAGGVGAVMVTYYNAEKDRRVKQVKTQNQKFIGKAAIGGTWTMVDLDGNLRTDEDFKGKFLFIYFGFTKCPDICPNELVKIGKIFDKLDAIPSVKGKVEPIFISIDPRRDTLAQMRQYAQDFHPKFKWLTGTPDQVNKIAKAYRVYWSKVDAGDEDDDDDYSVDHTIITYLMDPDGEFAELFTSSFDASQMISKIQQHVERRDEAMQSAQTN